MASRQSHLRKSLRYHFDIDRLTVTFGGYGIANLLYSDIESVFLRTPTNFNRTMFARVLANRSTKHTDVVVLKRKKHWIVSPFVFLTPDNPQAFIEELKRRIAARQAVATLPIPSP